MRRRLPPQFPLPTRPPSRRPVHEGHPDDPHPNRPHRMEQTTRRHPRMAPHRLRDVVKKPIQPRPQRQTTPQNARTSPNSPTIPSQEHANSPAATKNRMITTSVTHEVMLHVQACHHPHAPRMNYDDRPISPPHLGQGCFTVYGRRTPRPPRRRHNGRKHADAPEPAKIIAPRREILTRPRRTPRTHAEYQALCTPKG